MAMSHDHMQFVNLRRLAMARTLFALLANSEDHDPVLKVMNAEPGCRAAAGLTAHQEASLLAAVNEAPYSAQAAADVVSDIIATNHGEGGLAATAADMDLINTLRRIDRLVRINDEKTERLLRSKSPKDHFSAAANAIFLLREIDRIVAPLLTLLDTQAHVAGQSYPEAAE